MSKQHGSSQCLHRVADILDWSDGAISLVELLFIFFFQLPSHVLENKSRN